MLFYVMLHTLTVRYVQLEVDTDLQRMRSRLTPFTHPPAVRAAPKAHLSRTASAKLAKPAVLRRHQLDGSGRRARVAV